MSSISGCPTNKAELYRQLAALPAWIPKTFLVSSKKERVCKTTFAYQEFSGELPPGSFIEVAPDLAVATPEFLFVELARSLDVPLLVKLGCELCGTYSPYRYLGKKPIEREEPLTTIAALERYLAHAGNMHGVKRARRALKYILEGSASVKETEMALLLSMPKIWGGYGLEKPVMNYKIPFDTDAKIMAEQGYAKADLCWPEHKLDVEYDSTEYHSQTTDILHDKTRANGVSKMGYRVIFVTYEQFKNPEVFDAIARSIARELGTPLREYPASSDYQRYDLRDAFARSDRLDIFDSGLLERATR
ncbi:MAG: hypothetical protein ACOX69_11850 [Coriobacteriales bacterium]